MRPLLFIITSFLVGANVCTAQGVGLHLMIGDDAAIQVKPDGSSRWQPVWGHIRAIQDGDSVSVERGSLWLCTTGGGCESDPMPKGKHRVSAPTRSGLVGDIAMRVRRMLNFATPLVVRTTEPFASRSSGVANHPASRPRTPPALLLRGDGQSTKVRPEDFHLVWLPPAIDGQTIQENLETRVRIYQTDSACRIQTLVADTVARQNRIDFPDLLEFGTHYYVHISSHIGDDIACFRAATRDELELLEVRLKKVREIWSPDISRGEGLAHEDDFAIVGLLLLDEYSYDALLALDALRQRDPGDGFLLDLWSKMLKDAVVLEEYER